MKKTKLAIIATHPIPYFCSVYSSWSKLPELEVKVFFASNAGLNPVYDKQFGKNISWDNIDLNFQHHFLNDNMTIPINSKLEAEGLEKELSIFNPNVLLVYGFSSKYQRSAIKYSKKYNIKILSIRDTELRSKHSIMLRLKRKILLPTFLKRIDGFLTVSDSNEDFYQKYGIAPHKLYRTPFPIDIVACNKLRSNQQEINKSVREKYNLDSQDIIISIAGKIDNNKNQIELIKAIKILDEKYKNIVVFIIGSGPKENDYKLYSQKIQNNKIIFTGFIQPYKVGEIQSTSDIYIQTSISDPHPLAVSESIFLGCPVIIRDSCGSYGPNDDVRHGRNGFVYQSKNYVELSKYIDLLISNYQLRKSFSEESLKIGMENQVLAHSQGLLFALKGIGINY